MVTFLGASCLVSCVPMTGPAEIGPDTYVIELDLRDAESSDSIVLTQSIKKAAAFCSSKNKRMEIQTIDTTGDQIDPPHNNEVIFKCLSLNR